MVGLAIEPISTVRLPILEAFRSAILQVIGLISMIGKTIGMLITGIFVPNGASTGLMGPVGLAREVGGAATIGFTYLLAFTAAISVNLAVLNIMPFPALDGGRLLVVLLEALFRRRFSAKVIGIIHTVGFLLLLALMVVLTDDDISKLL
jgi:regulator of sigma E protease